MLLTRQRTIMLDTVMNVEVAKVEFIIPIISAQHVRSKIGYEKAETRGEIVRLANCSCHLFESDTTAVVGQYSCTAQNISPPRTYHAT